MIINKLKLITKELIGKTLNITNVSRNLIDNSFFVFCFHEITDNPSIFQKKNKLFITKKVFNKQIKFIKKLFKIVHPKEFYIKNDLNKCALITFDDGYFNSFNYAVNILNKSEIIPIFFLNMDTIKNKNPLLPASLEFLKTYLGKYEYVLKKYNIEEPSYLNIVPDQYKKFIKYINFNKTKIFKFQGRMINLNDLKKNQKIKKFFIADHLYAHYNCLALSEPELKQLSIANRRILKTFNNYINLFAFPNGAPKICFDKRNVHWIKKLKYIKAFSSGNKSNSTYKNFLIDRISLTNDDDTYNKFIFKIFNSGTKL